VFLPSVNLGGFLLVDVNLSDALLINSCFKDAIVRSCNFTGASLENADFSGAQLESTGIRISSRVGFSGARLQGADFRYASFMKANMGSANLRGAKMFGARIIDDDRKLWGDTAWWEADYLSEGNDGNFDKEAALEITKESVGLLLKQYGDKLPNDRNAIHPSINKLGLPLPPRNVSDSSVR
jgi:hypothetical protein